MASEFVFLKYLRFLSKWSQKIPEAFPLHNSSAILLCSSVDFLPNRWAVAEFLFSLKPVNMNLMEKLVAVSDDFISHLIKDIAKDMRCGEFYIEYTWNLIRSIDFLNLAKNFPGSPKVLWDTLMGYVEKAIHTENFRIMSMSLELLAYCLVLTSKDYDINYLSMITSNILNELCIYSLSEERLLHFFERFMISCACSLPLRERLLYSLTSYLTKHEVSFGMLTTIAEGLTLYKDYDKYFEQILILIYQKFEALSADGFNLFTDDSVFDTWCSLLLLSTQPNVPKNSCAVTTVLIRLICAHIALKPIETILKCLLLLARLFSHEDLGQITYQYCMFYNLNDHIIWVLCQTKASRSLLPSFLLNSEFALNFVANGSLILLWDVFAKCPTDSSIWNTLLLLTRISDFHPHILHHFDFARILTQVSPRQLLDLFILMVPPRIDLLERPELVCRSLVNVCWALLQPPEHLFTRSSSFGQSRSRVSISP
jgi:hypothetical protein